MSENIKPIIVLLCFLILFFTLTIYGLYKQSDKIFNRIDTPIETKHLIN